MGWLDRNSGPNVNVRRKIVGRRPVSGAVVYEHNMRFVRIFEGFTAEWVANRNGVVKTGNIFTMQRHFSDIARFVAICNNIIMKANFIGFLMTQRQMTLSDIMLV